MHACGSLALVEKLRGEVRGSFAAASNAGVLELLLHEVATAPDVDFRHADSGPGDQRCLGMAGPSAGATVVLLSEAVPDIPSELPPHEDCNDLRAGPDDMLDVDSLRQRLHSSLMTALVSGTLDSKLGEALVTRSAVHSEEQADFEPMNLADLRSRVKDELVASVHSGRLDEVVQDIVNSRQSSRAPSQAAADMPISAQCAGDAVDMAKTAATSCTVPAPTGQDGTDTGFSAPLLKFIAAACQHSQRIGELTMQIREVAGRLEDREAQCRGLEGKLLAARRLQAHLELDVEAARIRLDSAEVHRKELEAAHRALHAESEVLRQKLRRASFGMDVGVHAAGAHSWAPQAPALTTADLSTCR